MIKNDAWSAPCCNGFSALQLCDGQPPCYSTCQAGVQMRGITQRILTAEIVRPREAHDASASALRPVLVKACSCKPNATYPRPFCESACAVAVDRWPGPTCRSERRCVATCTYQRPLGGDWRSTDESRRTTSPGEGRFISLRSNQKLTDLRAVVTRSHE